MTSRSWADGRNRKDKTNKQVCITLKKTVTIMSETKKNETLKTVLQFIVSVLTALLATLGVQSCR